MQTRRLDVHDKLETPRNQEWVDIVLSFLKGFVQDRMHEDLAFIGKENLQEYTGNLLQTVCATEKGFFSSSFLVSPLDVPTF